MVLYIIISLNMIKLNFLISINFSIFKYTNDNNSLFLLLLLI